MGCIAEEYLVRMNAGPFGAGARPDSLQGPMKATVIIISQTASRVKVVAVGLAADQGETDESPIPAPSVTRRIVIAAAATAPPMIAPQDTAAADASAATTTLGGGTGPISSAIALPPQCHRRARMMMIGMGTPSSQRRIPRPIVLLPPSCHNRWVTRMRGENVPVITWN